MAPTRKDLFLAVAVIALALLLPGCQTTSPQGSADVEMQKALAVVKAKTADDLLVVDCLLPGQIRKLGKKMVYLTPRRAIKTTALECEIRGGEYVAYDRADYQTALQVWLPQAQQGDPEAQTYVGEIYEKGLGTAPDYKKAAAWYQKAAEKGYSRAQINLGYLYEKGLGVPQDRKEALKWYRKAAGANTGIAFDETALSAKERRELERLRRQSSLNQAQMARLRRRLQETQRALDRTRKQLLRRLEEAQAQGQKTVATSPPPPVEPPRQPTGPDENLLRLKKELQRRESELQRERLKMQKLQDQLASLENQTAAYQQQVEAVRRQQDQVAKLEQRMIAAQRELERARADIEKQRRAIAEEKRKLEQAKEEWKRQQAEAEKLPAVSGQAATQAADNEATRRQQEEIKGLQEQIASLQATSEQLRRQLAQANTSPVDIAGPDIEIIQPPVVVTRGVKIIPTGSPAKAQEIVGKVTAPAGLFSFTVNGLPQKVETSGLFRAHVPLMRGAQTPVEIVAVDNQGKRAAVEIVLARSSVPKADVIPTLTASPNGPKKPIIDFGSYYAIIIGNDHYRHFPNLATAISDARAVDQVLRTKYGFRTRLLLDATRYQILSALNHYREQLTEKDNLLIYYAGHGDLDKVNLRGYWLPVDAEPDNTANWISNVAITDILNAMSAKQVLVIADSCYSGALTRSAIARLEAGKSDEARFNWLRLMAQKRSRTVLTSGELKPVLDAGGGDHSVFAKALLEVLQANDDILEGQKLYREVSARVSYAAERYGVEQVPQYAPIRHAGHEAGDFFFVPKPKAT